MIHNNGNFKPFKELSENEKEFAYQLARVFIIESFNSGFYKAKFIKDNISIMTQETGLTVEELEASLDFIYKICMQKAIPRTQQRIGFK